MLDRVACSSVLVPDILAGAFCGLWHVTTASCRSTSTCVHCISLQRRIEFEFQAYKAMTLPECHLNGQRCRHLQDAPYRSLYRDQDGNKHQWSTCSPL
ncbi:hypothetical protein HDV63DRAFT_176654 [Trichoderma sp. SZMC 28014]